MRLSIQIEFDKILDLETNKTEVIVGRNPDCDFVINNSGISRVHCKIELIDGKFYITDLGSSNGVFINDHRLTPNIKVPFSSNSTLSLGKFVCELHKHARIKINSPSLDSTETSGPDDTTVTTRIARIDLSKDVARLRKVTLESSNIKGPRNPVSAVKEEVTKKKSIKLKILLFSIIFILLLVVGYYGYGLL